MFCLRGINLLGSKFFQGICQGGIISPFMFLCFNDDLLEQLVYCHVGFKVLNMNVCALTVADDMVLMALSIAGLAILCICYAYSCNGRYDYTAPKSSIIVFNETRYLGNNIVPESENYKHLGVNNNKYLNNKISIQDSTHKLICIFLSLVNSGILNHGALHPLTCKQSIIL